MRVDRAAPSGSRTHHTLDAGSGGFRSTLEASGRTPLAPAAAAGELRQAYTRLTGQAPSRRTLSILWAQWALETGRGRSMVGHNFGGLKGASPNGKSGVYWTTEGHGADATRIRSRFRAYDSPAEGADDYLRTLQERYPEALEGAIAESPDGFVRGLQQRRYFTADPAEYQRSIASLSREFETKGPGGQVLFDDPGPHVEMVLLSFRRAMEKRFG